MENLKINFVLIFFCIALASAMQKTDPEATRFSYDCLDDSVVVSFKQRPPYDVQIYTVASDKDESGCSRTFTLNEPAVKEFNFKSCSFAAKKFQVYVDEKYGRSVNQHYFSVDCKTLKKTPRRLFLWDYLHYLVNNSNHTL